jgi:hypothetical protein
MKMRGFTKAVGSAPWIAVFGMAILLSGCGWFDGPPALEKLRPGAERAIQPSDSLPAPAGRSYDPAIMPVDAATPALGSIVAASGGQKAQIEKLEKEASARDAEDRAAREKTAADNKAKADGATTPGTPGKQAAGDRPGEPPTQPAAPPRAPVSAAPVPPPATDTPLDPSQPAKPAGM